MIRKFLLKTRQLIDVLLSESPDETSHQPKVTVVGDNNTIITNGNTYPNLILPNNQNSVKRFTRQKRQKRD